MATYDLRYGVLVTGPYRDGCWRDDTYTPRTDSKHEYDRRPKVEPAMATGPDDDSNRHDKMNSSYGGKYDPECSCCWLNITHTERKHAQCVGKETKR